MSHANINLHQHSLQIAEQQGLTNKQTMGEETIPHNIYNEAPLKVNPTAKYFPLFFQFKLLFFLSLLLSLKSLFVSF